MNEKFFKKVVYMRKLQKQAKTTKTRSSIQAAEAVERVVDLIIEEILSQKQSTQLAFDSTLSDDWKVVEHNND